MAPRDLVRIFSSNLNSRGAELFDVSPEPSAQNSQWLKFEFRLDSDKEMVVEFDVLP